MVCTVRGEIDLGAETTFRAGLERAVGGVSMLMVDLPDVIVIGSVAAAIVIDVLQNRSDVQVLKIVSGRCGATVFTMTGLTETVDCFSNPLADVNR